MTAANHSDQPIATQDEPTQQRFVSARYLVRVTALQPDGTAFGRVESIIEPPHVADDTNTSLPDGVAYQLESATFVGGLPGELIELDARWMLPQPGRKRKWRERPPTLRALAVREAAPERVAAPCGVFGVCGGCQLQHMAYPAQLAWKTDHVRRLLADAGLAATPVHPALGALDPWRYRNHMRFSVNRQGQAGLTARGTSRVLPLLACPIATQRINDALPILSRHPLAQPQVLVRHGEATGQTLLQPAPPPSLRADLEAYGFALHDDSFEEELGGVRFRIRPSSFFQTNTAQAEVMARLVQEAAPRGSDITLVDAYCGVGTFARILAPQVGRVIAIEESASAVRDARASLEDGANIEVLQGKVEDILPWITERLDGLVIDPPRAGCQLPVLEALATRRPARVVYVSCDPTTLARDLAYLCVERAAYRVVSVQPLDMFPQTAHIENITVLEALA